MSLKQPDGSFVVSKNGEVDVRGTYCLLVVATLLDILTPELVEGTYDFLRSCQTYEGGFSASSQPYFSPSQQILSDPRPYLGEAHGGYTSCAVASLVLLRPLVPVGAFPGVNARNLLRWAVMMQGNEFDEGGAFRGRTNKLVDGCYSWWVGGLFPLIEELLGESTGESIEEHKESEKKPEPVTPAPPADDGGWTDIDGECARPLAGCESNRIFRCFVRQRPVINHFARPSSLTKQFLIDALQRYILIAAQQASGGLRDKPGASVPLPRFVLVLADFRIIRPADAYHTLYNLAGLSGAQHRVYSSIKRADHVRSKWVDSKPFHAEVSQAQRREAFVAALAWVEDEDGSRYVGDAGNRVVQVFPQPMHNTALLRYNLFTERHPSGCEPHDNCDEGYHELLLRTKHSIRI